MKIRLTKQGKSLTDLIDRLSAALRKKFRKPDVDEPLYWYPREVFDDAVIVSSDDAKLYRIPWAENVDGEIGFGEPAEVEEQYVSVGGQSRAAAATSVVSQQFRLGQSLDPEGWKWRCQVVSWGLSQTRHVWDREVFRQALSQWEGVRCFVDHASRSQLQDRPERSIKELVGYWSDFEISDQGMDATLNIKPSADWFRQDLMWAHKSDKPDFYMFSIFIAGIAKQVTAPDGKPATLFTEIEPLSVDAVTFGAAGGHAKYALASSRAQISTGSGSDPVQQGAKPMKELLLRLFKKHKDRFQTVRQALAGAQGVTAESTEEQLADAIHDKPDLVAQAMETLTTVSTPSGSEGVQGRGNDPAPGSGTGSTTRQADPAPAAAASTPITIEQLPAEMRNMLIAQQFRESDLPEAIQQSIRTRLGPNAGVADYTREIDGARNYLSVITQTGTVINPRAEVLAERGDKLMIGLAKSFDLSRDDYNATRSFYENYVHQSGRRVAQPDEALWNSIPPIRSLRQFYIDVTGDSELTGMVRPPQRLTMQANWLTSDFTELLAAVTGKRLLRDYRALDPTWGRVVTVKPVSDFKTQRAILLGYLADIATVAQEAGYAEATVLTDTEETYGISKRGRIVPLTLETVANDDLSGFIRIVGRLGRAAARTLLKFVWNTLIMANPTLNADAKALFHVDHGNLITDALGTTGLKNAITKLLSQTEPGSSEALVLSTMNLTLAVPPGLYLDAIKETDFNQEPGGNVDALAREIRRMGITPVNVPVFSDANDWLLCADRADIDMVEMAFWQGREEPEFFTQMDPTQGDYFAKDIVAKYKVRHIYGGAPVDHRGLVKSSVV